MGVYLHTGSPNWQIAFQYKGKKYSFTSGTTSEEEAKALEPEKREQVRREVAAQNASGPEVTFNQAMAKHWSLKIFDPRPQKEKSPDQIEREIEYYNLFEFIGDLVGLGTHCAAVDTTRMIEIRNGLRAARAGTTSGRLKNSTINRRMQLIFAVLNVAKDHMGTPLPKRPRMKEVRLPEDDRDTIIDYDDEEGICDQLPEECHAPFAFELETGLRRGDVVELKWSRVKLAEGVVMGHRKGKGRKLYPVPLNKRALAILKAMEGLHPVYVFTRPVAVTRKVEGAPRVETVRVPFNKRHFSKVMKKAFINAGHDDLHFHDLRRTAATRFYIETRDYEATRRFLGHGSVDVTKRYIKVALADVAAGVRRMDRARRGRGWKLRIPASAPAPATTVRTAARPKPKPSADPMAA